MSEPFILFGEQHTQALTYSFLIIAVLCVIGNFLSNKVQDIFAKLIGISLLVFEVTKPFIYIYGFDKPWETYLPLHMCNFSAVLIGIFLLQKKKNQMFFELPFYWGIGGATMALLTPDLTEAWPDIEFFMFFYGHGQIILGIFFALAVLKHRPYLQNFWKMAVITILLLVPILIVNLVIGGEANYWYLMNTPEGESLMDLIRSTITDCPVTSTPVVGSSKTIKSGSCIRVLTIDVFCFIPVLKSAIRLFKYFLISS